MWRTTNQVSESLMPLMLLAEATNWCGSKGRCTKAAVLVGYRLIGVGTPASGKSSLFLLQFQGRERFQSILNRRGSERRLVLHAWEIFVGRARYSARSLPTRSARWTIVHAASECRNV